MYWSRPLGPTGTQIAKKWTYISINFQMFSSVKPFVSLSGLLVSVSIRTPNRQRTIVYAANERGVPVSRSQHPTSMTHRPTHTISSNPWTRVRRRDTFTHTQTINKCVSHTGVQLKLCTTLSPTFSIDGTYFFAYNGRSCGLLSRDLHF